MKKKKHSGIHFLRASEIRTYMDGPGEQDFDLWETQFYFSHHTGPCMADCFFSLEHELSNSTGTRHATCTHVRCTDAAQIVVVCSRVVVLASSLYPTQPLHLKNIEDKEVKKKNENLKSEVLTTHAHAHAEASGARKMTIPASFKMD